MLRKPPAAGMGRKKGVPNKITGDVREMVIGALSGVGGREYLELQAWKNPVAFMALVAKVIPAQINATLNGTVTHEHLSLSEVSARTEYLTGERADSPAALALLQ